MTEFIKPKIFLSYAWANTDLVDEIDADLKKLDVVLTRDVRDLGYRKSIKDFMHTIGKHDFVLMLISDEYLRSENCMYEVTELLGTHEFKERILPIVHDNARHIFDSMGSEVYFEYWKGKRQKATAFNKKNANQVSVDALRKITSIHNLVDVFFTKLTDLNVYSLTQLKHQNYKPLLFLVKSEDEVENFEEKPDSNLTYILEDGFHDNRNKWPIGDYSSFIGTIQNGKFTIESRIEKGCYFPLSTNLDMKEDFTISCNAFWRNGGESDGFGLIYGMVYDTNSSLSFYVFFISADGGFWVSLMKDSHWENITKGEKSESVNKLSVNNMLRVEKVAKNMHFYINDSKVKSLPSPVFPGNLVGFNVGGKMKVDFGDFRIEGIAKK